MRTYEIEQYEIHVQKYTVEAANEAEAIAKLFDGLAEPVDNGLEYVEIAEDHGLAVDDHPALAEALRALGVPVDGQVIPSIRCIEEVVTPTTAPITKGNVQFRIMLRPRNRTPISGSI